MPTPSPQPVPTLAAALAPTPSAAALPIDSLLLAATPIATFEHTRALTNASGFFFERDDRLFLVTSRHVLYDKPSGHFPNRIEVLFHTSATNLSLSVGLSLLIYRDGRALWRQGEDSGGEVDVALIELDRSELPVGSCFHAFTPEHLHLPPAEVEVGTSVLVVGFPLGFHDTVHHLPVVRQAVVASAFGIRFQGKGYFLTDARTHRGTSGAPVVMRDTSQGALPWKLVGMHSARLDMANRDKVADESLGLNCAWYADILMTLSEP
jgi:hypothetical protein